MDAEAQSNFARSRLPWLVAAGAIVVYLLTLNRWISFNGLVVASMLEAPPPGAPLLYLLTLPFRLLPGAGPMVGLNVVSAVCAALTLALLARSIALLPHDRTREERRREAGAHGLLSLGGAWLPPLLAAMVLGTQLTFWEHATAATGEMLDLLLLAYVVRCLLEYRMDQRESWLFRMAFVYGLATTNNWAMIGFFPFALAALVWIRGGTFFRASLLWRLTLWGFAGLLLYLLMPIVQTFQEGNTVTLWQALRLELALQRNSLLSAPRLVALFASLTSLVPLFIISVRWPSNVGDTSAVGNILYNYVFRVLYLALLAFGLWMMLDPAWSPRTLLAQAADRLVEPGIPPSFLSFYYLAALALGYFLGYCLLVFGRPEPHRHHRRGTSAPWLGQAVAGLTILAALGTAGVLATRNLPVVRDNNGLLLRDYAARAVEGLPPEPAVLVADKPALLSVVGAYLKRIHDQHPYLPVSSPLLPRVDYQRLLYQQAPTIWPDFVNHTNLAQTARIPDDFLSYEMAAIANQTPTYYLHSSFGYYFERLHLEPHQLIFRLRLSPTNTLPAVPAPTPDLLASNTAYWEELWPQLGRVVDGVRRGSSDARLVGRWYSQGYNVWGVTLQRTRPDAWETAATCFERALLLSPDNVSARINLDYNRSRQTGKPRPRISSQDAFGTKYRTWSSVMRANGPIDDPQFSLELGQQFLEESLFLQSSREFLRVLELQPENQRARLWLVVAQSESGLHEQVLTSVDALRQSATPSQLTPQEEAELSLRRAQSLIALDRAEEAERELRQAVAAHARDAVVRGVMNALVQLYLSRGQGDAALALVEEQLPKTHPTALEFIQLLKAKILMSLERNTEAGPIIDQVLARNPDNPYGLLTQSAYFITLQQYSNAIPPLDRLLSLPPGTATPLGRLNRAIAHLQCGNLDQAREDYLALLPSPPRGHAHAVYFGLGEIAWRRKDTTEARERYTAYLGLVPSETEESKEVARRLEQLRSGPP